MKLKQVAEDDPSAEWEVTSSQESRGDGNIYGADIKRIPPREKTNAEVAKQLEDKNFGDWLDLREKSRVAGLVRDILDAVDAKIERSRK